MTDILLPTMKTQSMHVIKRNGRREPVQPEKILQRLTKLKRNVERFYGRPLNVSVFRIARATEERIYDGITTSELDGEAAEISGYITVHPDYALFAGCILVSNLEADNRHWLSFQKYAEKAYHYVNHRTGKNSPLISDELFTVAKKYGHLIDRHMKMERNFLYDHFSMQTLLQGKYLLSAYGRVQKGKGSVFDALVPFETPQHMWMRVALGLWGSDLERAFELYDVMSQHQATMATPTLFNMGTARPQGSSCFVAGSLVHTKQGPKPIETVAIGDEVISHTGLWRKVVQLHKNPLGDRTLYTLKCRFTRNIKVTGNHRLWAITDDDRKPRWIRVDQMPKNTFVALPQLQDHGQYEKLDVATLLPEMIGADKNIIRYEVTEDKVMITTVWPRAHPTLDITCKRKHNPVNRIWNLDDTFAIFLGIWLGDGHITADSKPKSHITGIGITLHPNNEKMKEFLKDAIPRIFGVEPSSYMKSPQNVLQIAVRSRLVGMVFNHLFGRGFAGKHLHPMMYNWNHSMIRSLMIGLISSDGCVTKDRHYPIQLSNGRLSTELYHLVRSIGQPISLRKRGMVKGGTEPSFAIRPPSDWIKPSECLKFYEDDRLDQPALELSSVNAIRLNGQCFVRVLHERNTIQKNLPEFVYTLGVEEDHSYMVQGIVAENCFLLTMEDDSIDGIYNTLKECAKISKHAGGIGVSIHNIRCQGSYIEGTNGTSNGIVPMLKNFNDTARYVDQCFDPETVIYTQRGPLPMKAVLPNDRVVTHDGSLRRVQKILYHTTDDDTVTLSTAFGEGEPVTVTAQHPIQRLPCYVNRAYLDDHRCQPEFVEAGELFEKDWVAFPVPSFEEDLSQASLDDCRMLGLLIAGAAVVPRLREGSMAVMVREGSPTEGFVRRYLSLTPDVNQTRGWRYGEQYLLFRWHPSAAIPWNPEMWSSSSDRDFPVFVSHLPLLKLQQVLIGFMEGSGRELDDRLSCTVRSSGMKRTLDYLWLRCGLLSIMEKDEAGRWQMAVPSVDWVRPYFDERELKAVDEDRSMLIDGVLYCRIDAIEYHEGKSGEHRVMLDFEIEHHPCYLTQVGLAHNGGGKRKGSFAIYLEPWHGDIFQFLDLKRPSGVEDQRCRDLFYGLWVPDLFWKRVTAAFGRDVNEERDDPTLWSLMCPHECPGLSDSWGAEFEELYTRYEAEGRYLRQVPIKELMYAILTAQVETGTPYILHKDHCNRKSNQKNLGTIHSSNLCSEIVEYSSPDEIAVCNLASLSLPAFVDRTTKTVDYALMERVSRIMIRALNRVIDRNYYPVEKARRSNMRHRPVGLGVQGQALMYALLNVGYGSPESKVINRRIAETRYYASVSESHTLTQEFDPTTGQKLGPYPSMRENGGAPISHGLFQFDLWREDFAGTSDPDGWKPDPALGLDWDGLRERVKRDGVRNSLLIAQMPTASTSNILGNPESFEPYFAMMFLRKTKSGQFFQFCRPLIERLIELGLWEIEVDEKGQTTVPMLHKILANRGSVQGIPEIPQEVQDVFRTVWDIPVRDLADMSRDRALFTCQSESFNVHFKNKDNMMPAMLKFLTYTWKKGLKTGSYYCRTQQQAEANNFVSYDLKEETECASCSG